MYARWLANFEDDTYHNVKLQRDSTVPPLLAQTKRFQKMQFQKIFLETLERQCLWALCLHLQWAKV